jgi:hypothetical protein
MATMYGNDISFLSDHYYAEGPGSSPNVTIDRLMRSSDRLDRTLIQLSSAAQSSGLPWRMTEGNSVYGGGRYDVSDTMAAAVWGVDLQLRIASCGGLGMNFHGGDRGPYSPVKVVDGVSTPRPIFYSMLLLAQLGSGSIAQLKSDDWPDGLSAYSVKGADGVLNVVVVNSNLQLPANIQIRTIRRYRGAIPLRLSSPAYDSNTGITLGGNAIAPDNTWTAATTDVLPVIGGTLADTVPAASATLYQFR